MAEVVALRPAADRGPEVSLFEAPESLRLLIPGGADFDVDVVFGDDLWDLSGHPTWHPKAGTRLILDFTTIGPRWRMTAKNLALLQMNPRLAVERAEHAPLAQTWARSQEAIKPITAQGNLKMLKHATDIIDAAHIYDFDEAAWERLRLLLVTPRSKAEKQDGALLSPATGRGRAQQLRALWEVAQILDRPDLLSPDSPFGGRESTELYALKSNRNSVRPTDAVGELLGFTGWVVDHVLEDIVATVEWWAASAAPEPPMSQAGLYDDMLNLLCNIAESHHGALPGVRNLNGGLTLAHGALGRLLGQSDADEAYLAGRWAMRQLGDAVTLSEDVTPCPVTLATFDTPAGPQTWTRRLLPSKHELDAWQRYAIYACMYYLSATLMLRDSQLSLLPLGSLSAETLETPDGTPFTRYELHAYRTKNRHTPVPTKVVVSARVAKLITLLERLQAALGYQPALAPTGQPFLLDQRLAVPFGKEPRVDARDGLYLDLGFDKVLANAAARLHERGVIARDLTGIKVNMREVRITCAQAYASREYGAALSAAYGQWDTRQVAAGYVGDIYKRLITPIDPEEVEDELMAGKARALIGASRERETLSGRGLPRLDEAIERSAPRLANGAPLTPARQRALGKDNRNIHQGTLTLCIWQPEGAMCEGVAGPDFAKCAPGQCRNSIMTPADRARYELRRRSYLDPDTPVGRRGAARLDQLNPEIKPEFDGLSDDELQDIIKQHYEQWLTNVLEPEK